MVEKRFIAEVDNLHEVLEFLECQLEAHEASMKVINVLSISLEELYANVCMYAYEGLDSEKWCTIKIGFENDDVIISIVDAGIPFNPLEKEDPDVHASAEERGVGGLGIYMVKKYVDECTYDRVNDMNIFTMRKAIR